MSRPGTELLRPPDIEAAVDAVTAGMAADCGQRPGRVAAALARA